MKTPWKTAYGVIGWLGSMASTARQLQSLGVEGIEGFGLTELLREDLELKTQLHTLNMKYVGSYFSGSFVQPDRLKTEMEDFRRTVAATVALGGTVLIVGGGRDFRTDTTQQPINHVHWQTLCQSAHEMGRICREAGARLAFHPHQGTLVYHSEEIHRFAKDTDPSLVQFTFDTAHLTAGGSDSLAIFQNYSERVIHVHLKDLCTKDKRQDFVALGKGEIPLKAVLELLWKRWYTGWVTIELDATSDPLENAKSSLKHLAELTSEVANESPKLSF